VNYDEDAQEHAFQSAENLREQAELEGELKYEIIDIPKAFRYLSDLTGLTVDEMVELDRKSKEQA
jgi:hypothetical protein